MGICDGRSGGCEAVCDIGICTDAKLQIGDLKPQEFANTAWAVATFVPADAKLFATLALSQEQSCNRRLQDTGARQHSMGIGGICSGGCEAVRDLGIGTDAALRVYDFKPQELASTAW